MNGYQKTRAAVEGRRPETGRAVPVMLHNFLLAAEEAGYSQGRYREDPQAAADAHIRAVDRYGHDGVLFDMDTTVLAGAVGVPIDYPEHEPARARGALLVSLEDVGRLKKPDLEASPYIGRCLEAVRRLVEHFDRDIYVRGNCDQCPFSLATMVRGPAELMMDLCDEDAVPAVEELLEFCSEVSLRYLGLMAQTGCHMLSNGDSPAGPDLISPQMYGRFALPYERRQAEEAHRLGLPYALHICGDTTRILEQMAASGADCLELDYKTDQGLAHELLAGCATRVAFIGNLDPTGVIGRGTTGLVARAARELLELFADTPRFILNAGCAIPPGTPQDNIRTMVAAAREAR